MKKRKKGKKLSRKKKQRLALKKTLAVSLISKKKVKTTLAKAKELRPFIEKLITRAKKQNIAARRYLARYLSQKAAEELFKKIAPQFKDKPGGYTRIVKTGRRKKDATSMAIIEFTYHSQERKKQHEKVKKTK